MANIDTYELLMNALELLASIEEDAGEITDETALRLDAFMDAADDQLGTIRATILRLKNEQSFLRTEELRIAARRKRLDGFIGWFTDRAAEVLEAHRSLGHEPKIKTPTYTCWLQTSQSVHVDTEDVTSIDPEWLVQQEPKVNKAAALKELKAGTSIQGLSLIDRESIRWR